MPAISRPVWAATLLFAILTPQKAAPATPRKSLGEPLPGVVDGSQRLVGFDDMPKVDFSNPLAVRRIRNRAAKILNIRAGFFLRRGELLKAVMAAREAIWNRPNDPTLYVRLGEVYQEAGFHQTAITAWSQAIQLNSRYALPYALRARAWVDLGEPDKAIGELDTALRTIGPTALLLHQRALAQEAAGNLDKAGADLLATLQIDMHRADARADLGRVLLRQGRPADAAAEATEALELQPKLAAGYLVRAQARQKLGQAPSAEADFTAAIDLDPDQSEAYLGRGVLQRERGLLDAAARDLSRASRSDKLRGEAYFQLAQVELAKGDPRTAIADFTESLRLQPNNPIVFRARAMAWIQRGGLTWAIDDATAAIRLDRGDADAYAIRSAAAMKSGDFRQALADACEAVRLRPNDPLLLSNRGALYESLGDLSRALADYDQAVRLKPDSWAARHNRASAAIKMAKQSPPAGSPASTATTVQSAYWHQALADLDEAARLKPGDLGTSRQRASVFKQLAGPDR